MLPRPDRGVEGGKQAINMSFLFCQTSAVNEDLSKWNVGKFVYMHNMFSGSKPFNQDMSRSNVRQVADMDNMFSGATSVKKVICGET